MGKRMWIFNKNNIFSHKIGATGILIWGILIKCWFLVWKWNFLLRSKTNIFSRYIRYILKRDRDKKKAVLSIKCYQLTVNWMHMHPGESSSSRGHDCSELTVHEAMETWEDEAHNLFPTATPEVLYVLAFSLVFTIRRKCQSVIAIMYSRYKPICCSLRVRSTPRIAVIDRQCRTW